MIHTIAKYLFGVTGGLGTIDRVAFWTALAATGGIISLRHLSRQMKYTRDTNAYEFLRKEDDRFSSGDMRRDRSNFAKTLLLTPNEYEEIDKYADYVLGYFEDLGTILKQEVVPDYSVWTFSGYYILRYWEVSKKYIDWVKQDEKDSTYYSNFAYLYKRMLRIERNETKKKKIEFTPDELREFLEDELHVELRSFSLADLNRILEIEKSSFKEDAYPKSQFVDLYKEHPEDFLVAEISGKVVGYIVGYISNDIGEIDSIAVNPLFRHLGIGRKLSEFIIKGFTERGITTCSLEVCKANDVAIHFYEKMGFKIVEALKNYYDDGEDAYLMRMNIL